MSYERMPERLEEQEEDEKLRQEWEGLKRSFEDLLRAKEELSVFLNRYEYAERRTEFTLLLASIDHEVIVMDDKIAALKAEIDRRRI